MRVAMDDLYFEDGFFFAGKLFTGTAVEQWDDGSPRAERDYFHGFKQGWGREWSRDGQLLLEEPTYAGRFHGILRSWHPNGQRSTVAHFALGYQLTCAMWNSAGERGPDYRIDKTSQAYDNYRREAASVLRLRGT